MSRASWRHHPQTMRSVGSIWMLAGSTQPAPDRALHCERNVLDFSPARPPPDHVQSRLERADIVDEMTPTRRRVSSISSAELGIRQGMRMKQSDDAQSARLQGLTRLSEVLSSKFPLAWLKSPIYEKHKAQGARFCRIDDQQADHLELVGLLSMPRTAMQPPEFPVWKTKRPYHLCSVRLTILGPASPRRSQLTHDDPLDRRRSQVRMPAHLIQGCMLRSGGRMAAVGFLAQLSARSHRPAIAGSHR